MARTRKAHSRQANIPEKPESQSGLGPESAGQSGDLQGLSARPQASPESVEELADEGQGLEAAAVAGVEDAEDRDGNPREVYTHEVPEDDVPEEYLEGDDYLERQ